MRIKPSIWILLAGTILMLGALLLIGRSAVPKPTPAPLTPQEEAWLKEHPVIRLAPDPDFPPVEYFDATGRYCGIAADYLSLLQKKLGIRVQIVRLNSWSEAIEKVEAGEIDLLAAVTKTPQRSKSLLFTSPYLQLPTVIITRKSIAEPLTLEKLSGMRVSAVAGYAAREYLAASSSKILVDPVPDARTGLQRVSFGLSDALVENLGVATHYIEKEGITNLRVAGKSGFDYRLSFAARQDRPELISIIEKGLGAVTADERQGIYSKWIPLESRALVASKKYQRGILVALGAALLLSAVIMVWNRSLQRVVERKTAELKKELREREEAEARLRKSEEKFRALAETFPASIFVYQGTDIIYVNPATEGFSGYSEEECLKMKFWDLVHEDQVDMVKERGLARLRGEAVPSHYEALVITKGGGKRWVHICAAELKYQGAPSVIVTLFDLTARKEAEEALRTLNEELETRVAARTADLTALNADLLQEIAVRKRTEEALRLSQFCIDKAALAIYQSHVDGNFVYANEFACESLGYSAFELNRLPLWLLDPCITQEEMDRIKEILSRDGSVTHETVHRRRDGTTFPVEVTSNVLTFNGRLTSFSFVKDITERRLAEVRLREKGEQLEELNATLEQRVVEEVEKNRAKDLILVQQNRQAALGEALEHIAHQWKQPLNTIALMTQYLQSVNGSNELTGAIVQETATKTLKLIDHMAQTIDVFKDFYKPEKEKVVFRVKDPIDTSTSFLTPSLRHRSIALAVDIDASLSAVGYPKEYAQVLMNLISNARDAFQGKGVEKQVVQVTGYAEDNRAVVTVTDNAGGIPESILGNIFDLYFTTKQSTGSGIGLYMSKTIIEGNMGGKLSVRNVERGAQFTIELPLPPIRAVRHPEPNAFGTAPPL